MVGAIGFGSLLLVHPTYRFKRAALATRFLAPHAHGRWQLWSSLADVLIGLAVVTASAYVIYVLEIVKVSSPRARRRSKRLEQERRSA